MVYDRVPCVRSREAMVVGVFIHCASRELGRACAAGRAYTRYSRRAFLSTPPFPRTYASRTRTPLQPRIWTLYSKRSLSRGSPNDERTTRLAVFHRVRSRTPIRADLDPTMFAGERKRVCVCVSTLGESTIGRGMEHASTYGGTQKGGGEYGANCRE